MDNDFKRSIEQVRNSIVKNLKVAVENVIDGPSPGSKYSIYESNKEGGRLFRFENIREEIDQAIARDSESNQKCLESH